MITFNVVTGQTKSFAPPTLSVNKEFPLGNVAQIRPRDFTTKTFNKQGTEFSGGLNEAVLKVIKLAEFETSNQGQVTYS